MTGLDLDRIEAAARAATPGPWEVSGSQVWDPSGTLVAAARDHSLLVDRPDAAYIALMDPAMTLALIERLREAEQLVQRLWVLARYTDLAMDLWWRASDDNWAVPDDLPSRFLEFSLAACGDEWESAEVDDRLAAVDALHSPQVTAHEEDWACYEDARDWPCPTHLAAHPECADACMHGVTK